LQVGRSTVRYLQSNALSEGVQVKSRSSFQRLKKTPRVCGAFFVSRRQKANVVGLTYGIGRKCYNNIDTPFRI